MLSRPEKDRKKNNTIAFTSYSRYSCKVHRLLDSKQQIEQRGKAIYRNKTLIAWQKPLRWRRQKLFEVLKPSLRHDFCKRRIQEIQLRHGSSWRTQRDRQIAPTKNRAKSCACVAQFVLGNCSATTTDRLTAVDEAFVKLPAVLGWHRITVIRHISSLPSAAGICNGQLFQSLSFLMAVRESGNPLASQQVHDHPWLTLNTIILSPSRASLGTSRWRHYWRARTSSPKKRHDREQVRGRSEYQRVPGPRCHIIRTWRNQQQHQHSAQHNSGS